MSFTYIVVVFCCPVRLLSHVASPHTKIKKVKLLVVMVYWLQESPEVTL